MGAGAEAAGAYRNAAAGSEFVRARDFLVAAREDYAKAYTEFRWPVAAEFKIRRDELRRLEMDRQDTGAQGQLEFREEDLRAESSPER